MHDLKAKIELEKEWLRIDSMPWEQPMERIKVKLDRSLPSNPYMGIGQPPQPLPPSLCA